jgi:multiple sugar transport system substrate-binding protein
METTRRINRRTFLGSSALAAAGLAAGGLGAPTTSQAATRTVGRARAGSQIKVTIWGWWDIRMNIYRDAAKDFTKLYPNVTFEVVSIPTGYEEKVYAAVAAGTGPTLLKMGPFFFHMRDQGLLAPFPRDLFTNSWLQESYPNFDWATYGRYVVPQGSLASILVYNKRMFAEAGIKAPPQTWDELIAMAKELTRRDSKGNITRAGFVPGNDQFAQMDLLYQLGGSVVRREGSGRPVANFNSPQMATVYQFLVDLATKHKVWSPDFLASEPAMGSNKAAMTLCESFQIGDWQSSYASFFKDMGIAAPPTPSGQAKPYYGHKKTVLDLSVMAGRPGEEQMAAFEYLSYIYRRRLDNQFRHVTLSMMPPERKELLQYPALLASPMLRSTSALVPHEKDPVQELDQIITIFNDVLTQVLVTKQSLSSALEYGQEQMRGLITKGLATYVQ